MSAHVIRLTIVALLAAFYYAVSVALGVPNVVTIVVVLYAVVAGVLTVTLAAAAGGEEPHARRATENRGLRGERARIRDERPRTGRAPRTRGRPARKRRAA
jgi:hypothetical protein